MQKDDFSATRLGPLSTRGEVFSRSKMHAKRRLFSHAAGPSVDSGGGFFTLENACKKTTFQPRGWALCRLGGRFFQARKCMQKDDFSATRLGPLSTRGEVFSGSKMH